MKFDLSYYQEMIAMYYGYNNRADLLIEEMAELTQALIKERRYPKEKQKRKEDIIEEVADVLLCLKMLINLANITEDQIKKVEDFKTKRELERIEKQWKSIGDENYGIKES